MEAEQQLERETVKQVSKVLKGLDPDDFKFRLTTDKGVEIIHWPVVFNDGSYKVKKDIQWQPTQDCCIKKLEVYIDLLGIDYTKWAELPIGKVHCLAGSDVTFTFEDNLMCSIT